MLCCSSLVQAQHAQLLSSKRRKARSTAPQSEFKSVPDFSSKDVFFSSPQTLNLSSQDRALIAKLFEDWLQADEDWNESSIVYNSTLTKKQKKRGKHVMKTFRDLKIQYGVATAKSIREKKKELGSSFWHQHPEVPDNEDPWPIIPMGCQPDHPKL